MLQIIALLLKSEAVLTYLLNFCLFQRELKTAEFVLTVPSAEPRNQQPWCQLVCHILMRSYHRPPKALHVTSHVS